MNDTINNPYVGPRTFTEADSNLFFGRDREARDLLALVVSERLVLFYAQSGAGKSSLINTRLVPGLREEGFAVLSVGRVSGELGADISSADVDNIFIFNLLLSLNEGLPDEQKQLPGSLTKTTLADFLQGEEEEPLPDDDQEYYYEEIPHVLIIDQFEEIVTTHLERWTERSGFFEQVREAMERHHSLWVVLTMREDYVTALDPYAQLLPNRLRTRFYMQRMGERAALQAIKKPAERGGRPFAPEVAETLVDNLRQIRVHGQVETQSGQFIEPVQLQVVCYQLWENLKDRPQAEITTDDLTELGDIDATLAQFYEQAIGKVIKQTRELELRLRNWFENQLITEAGTRGMVYQGPKKTGDLKNKTVDLLANQYLLRSEIRAGGVWYELTHDRFVGPIQKSNADWRNKMLKKWGSLGAGVLALLILLLITIPTFVQGERLEQAQAEVTQIAATSTTQAKATLTAVAGSARERPLRPGLSISGAEVTEIGTLGYFVQDSSGQIYILSTHNVLGRGETEVTDQSGEMTIREADVVLQPGLLDDGLIETDQIGSRLTDPLSRVGFIPATNLVALAQLTSEVKFETTIPEIDLIQGVRTPEVGMAVRKFGRSTGLTKGEITAVDQVIELFASERDQSQLQTTQGITLYGAVRISLEAAAGDVGALVVDDDGYAIGILVDASEAEPIMAPIQAVLETFDVRLILPSEPIVEPNGGTLGPGENQYIYGLFDRGGEHLMIVDGEAKGWVSVSQAIGKDPNERGGGDYRDITDKGLGLIVNLVHAFGEGGTIPGEGDYPAFAQRAANFVEDSKGASIWMIGNEMNLERERPRLPGSQEGQPITPRRYAELYKLVRTAIKSVPGHEDDLVITGPIAPWNGETPYEADPGGEYPANKTSGAPGEYPYRGFFGDYIQYLHDMLVAIGPENLDGIAVQAISRGYSPELIFSEAKLGSPFEAYFSNFYTYRDQMDAIPEDMRHLPVYITRMEGDREPDGATWPFGNNGWVKNAYQEIDDWNQAGNQQIRAAILYRWALDPLGWSIENKPEVQEDFKEAIARDYRWDSSIASISISAGGDAPSSPTATPLATPVTIPTFTSLEIQDVSASLDQSSTEPPYEKRPVTDIRRLVIHHTATPATISVERLAGFFVHSRNLPGIAYHFCVTARGEVYQTQPLTVVTSQAGDFSSGSLGVCLIGNFTDAPPPSAQLRATAALLSYLTTELNISASATTIVGYQELVPTQSPGRTWPSWKTPLIEAAKKPLSHIVKTIVSESQMQSVEPSEGPPSNTQGEQNPLATPQQLPAPP